MSSPKVRSGDQAVERVAPFDRLHGPRIDVPEDAQGIAPLRQFCPERTDTCRKYWAYTINFVQNYTIPLRDKEVLILRTACTSPGHSLDATGASMSCSATSSNERRRAAWS